MRTTAPTLLLGLGFLYIFTLVTIFPKILFEKINPKKQFCNFEKIIKNMDLQTRKLELIKIFLHLQNEEIISSIENLLKIDKKNSMSLSESIIPFSIDELNNRIDKSLEDSRNGKLIEVTDLLTDIEKWY